MKLDMIGIVVAEIQRSLPFYRHLGWTIPEPTDDSPYYEITLPTGLRISWNAESMVKEIEADWHQPVGQRISMAFLCESPAEVDAKFAAIVQAGYIGKRAPWDAFWGQRYAQVMDPDGNCVDLFAPLQA